jgi:DNA-binding transcriptional ArsR family regulator
MGIPSASSNDVQTKVIQDSVGDLHVLSFLPELNNSSYRAGIWYSKYNQNGTDLVPPTEVANDTTIQSTDLTVDSNNNAVIVWADDVAAGRSVSSGLYLLNFNSTEPKHQLILALQGSLVLWPSVAMGKNNTVHIAWVRYTPSAEKAIVEYSTLGAGRFETEQQIASYSGVDVNPLLARLVFDNSSGHFQVAWGESESEAENVSTVNYGVLVSNGTLIERTKVATFNGTLRDLSIAPIGEGDAAFIIWRTQALNDSIYVSQISASTHLAYVKELNYTRGYRDYIAASADLEDNLYVVWYQPSVPSSQGTPTTPTQSTNVTYLRMNPEGDIVQTGVGVFKAAVIGVTVLNDGIVYGVSPNGLVSVVTPTPSLIHVQNNVFAVTAVAWVSVLSLAGFAGSVLPEEGRYRWVALYSRIAKASDKKPNSISQETLKLLARRPGLRIRELKRFTGEHPIDTMSLVCLERNGFLASFRDGLSRRFYVKDNDVGPADALRTRILLWVLDHPGIWEAQLAKDLGLSQQTTHYHLKKLRETKLITARVCADGSRKLCRFADSSSKNHDQNRKK